MFETNLNGLDGRYVRNDKQVFGSSEIINSNKLG